MPDYTVLSAIATSAEALILNQKVFMKFQRQSSLFEEAEDNSLSIVEKVLEHNGALAISVSGGKDSQALLNYLAHERQKRNWQGEYFAIHADLGRAEWKQTPAHVEGIARQANVPLVVVRREKGDLIDRFRERKEQLFSQGNSKPFWADSKNRYCTSDMKREPINKYLRKYSLKNLNNL